MTNEESIKLLKRIADRRLMIHVNGEVVEAKPDDVDKAISIAIAALERDRWISVEERLPEPEHDVFVMFPNNMAVASIDVGEWVVNSGDGWCTDICLDANEKNPTHWRPLPEPPKEET